ncbi:Protein kinase subdomain-containing protein [Colletotrichum higginsianum IMI 349063]|uniref:Protein kinase subdomain-containing protein n=2 Tax=Colletotrichum higginsianum (strain IMI 349063) TaxID=759273 RepID=A0A1B7YJZ7_COLHI|nr:Protein kinase subdomain-containing protein [Colletotrichum higginsianum IMI 349063]OBR12399.1 Protein kinase subdomain-containing protein [Colletotrichum higginsianum IMI 349063]GJC94084.1 protein kinase subdomain-containing protein [Colletotrichum higginsianum]
MASRPWDTLPAETLVSIAAHLEGVHLPDLSSFALTSKSCYAAAACHLFRDVHIRIKHPRKLHRDVAKWLAVLRHANAARHVRRLVMTFEDKTLHHSDLYSPDRLKLTPESADSLSYAKRMLPENRRLRDAFVNPEAWAPMVQLLKVLAGLTDMVIEHESSFSPYLLEALGTQHTKCLLELRCFDLHCTEGTSFNPYDVALLLSPQLHGISIKEYFQSFTGHTNESVVSRLVKGLSPSLKKVELEPVFGARYHRRCNPEFESQLQTLISQATSDNLKYWRNAAKATVAPKIGSVPFLSLQRTSPERIRAWVETTDFALLRHLRLNTGSRELRWLAKHAEFRQLDSLELHNRGYIGAPSDEENFDEIENAAVDFLAGMPALTSLSLEGQLTSPMLRTAVSRFGGTLRKLMLRPTANGLLPEEDIKLGPEHIDLLPLASPLLEDLTITVAVPTFLSQSTELAGICESLARVPHLRSLHLTLRSTTEEDPLMVSKRRRPRIDRDGKFQSPDILREELTDEVVKWAWEAICERGSRLELLRMDTLYRWSGARKSEKVHQVRRIGAMGEGVVAETLYRRNRVLRWRE